MDSKKGKIELDARRRCIGCGESARMCLQAYREREGQFEGGPSSPYTQRELAFLSELFRTDWISLGL